MKTILCSAILFGLIAPSLQQMFCKSEDRECMVGMNQCCDGLTCRKRNLISSTTTCQTTSGGGLCNKENDDCTPNVDPCCSGLVCERNVFGNRKCKKTGGICKIAGRSCVPSLNSECCSDLTCQAQFPSSSSYTCQTPCLGANEKCTIGVNTCCGSLKCKRKNNLAGTVCMI